MSKAPNAQAPVRRKLRRAESVFIRSESYAIGGSLANWRCACAGGVIPFGARQKTMEKHNYDAGLPATNAPFNLCVRYGDLIFISGLPPFDEEFDRIYRTYFSGRETLPARTRIQAGRTPMDCGLEVEAIGYVPKKPARSAAQRHKRRGARSRRSR